MTEQPLWAPAELVAATGGTLRGTITRAVHGVSIDTRTLTPGDLFVAIKGEIHDGHDFVVNALKAGAGVALVSRVTPEMLSAGAVIVVDDDPLDGLVRLGKAARLRSKARIIAVTGSVGKTSTKEMLRDALAASGATHVSAASFNNHWGVPLTLARMPADAAYGVFEIGMNHAGEITPLVNMVQPHIAIITAIAESHIGHFASLDEIADAKAEIFSGLVDGGHAVLNRDSAYFNHLRRIASMRGIRNIASFGRDAAAEVQLESLALHSDCCCITASIFGEKTSYRLGLPGEHMAMNSLAVLAAVKLAGADLARAALGLAAAQPAKGRGVQQRLQFGDGELLLLDESYNANPASVRAAIDLMTQMKPGSHGRRIAVLGDMLELGEFGPKLHADIAEVIEQRQIDQVYACGPLMAHLWELLPQSRRGGYAENSTELKSLLLASLREGDVIMIKGSLGSRMGLIADALRAEYQAANKERT